MNDNWGLSDTFDGIPTGSFDSHIPDVKPKNKKKKDQKRGKRRRGINLLFGMISDWWNREPEDQEDEKAEQQAAEARKKAEEEAARRKEEEISLSKEYLEHNSATLIIDKQLDPFDEIEITLHIVPLDIGTGDNMSLVQPSFKFNLREPDDDSPMDDASETDKEYQGVGTNLPDRIFVMNNRDYNLGVANHADKWAVFWLFTVGVSCFPRCLQR